MSELHRPDAAQEAIRQSDTFAWRIELLRDETSIGGFIDRSSRLAEEAYFSLSSPELVSFRAEIESGLDPEAVQKVVKIQDFGNLNPATSEYDRLIAVASLKTQLQRQIIREVVSGENSFDLSRAETVVVLGSCDIGDQFDLFYREWRKKVIGDPFLEKLSEMEKAEAKKLLQEQGVMSESDNYLYSVLDETDGKIISSSYAEAFPEPIIEVGNTINQMVADLKEIGDDEALDLASYYESFGNALISTERSQHERLWKEVDVAWMKVSGRIQPIHPMESYVDPNGLLVEPEYALAIRDYRDRAATTNALTDMTKNNLIQWLEINYGEKDVLQTSLPPLRSSIVGVFTTLVSGRRLDFRPAGQIIPNRPEVRINNGVKIFLDLLTMDQRWQVSRTLLVKAFGEEAVANMFNIEPYHIEVGGGVHVAGHEVAHNAFIQIDTRRNLGEDQYKQIEEHKSDAIIIAAAPSWLSLVEQQTFLKALFAGRVRSLSQKEDKSKQPYYNSSVFIINNMIEAGIISYDGNAWHYNDKVENVDVFFELVRQIVHDDLIPVYETCDPALAKIYIEKHFQPSELVQTFEETINHI